MAKRIPLMKKNFYRYFLVMGVFDLALLTLAIIFQGEQFVFFQDALSYLGWVETAGGTANLTGAFFYWLSMIVSGILMFLIAATFWQMRNLRWKNWMVFLAMIAGVGFFVGVAPDDALHRLHQIGSTMFFGSLWLFGVLFLVMLHGNIKRWQEVMWHVLYQAAILLYAGAYVLEHPTRHVFQKLSVFVLFLTLVASSYLVVKLKAYKR